MPSHLHALVLFLAYLLQERLPEAAPSTAARKHSAAPTGPRCDSGLTLAWNDKLPEVWFVINPFDLLLYDFLLTIWKNSLLLFIIVPLVLINTERYPQLTA